MDIILVPGFWLDGSSWSGVIPRLVADGHRVRAMTLPGMQSLAAERGHITLQDHVDAVVAAIDEAGGDVVLVGHSGGAGPVHAAVDARPDRVARAIYVDAVPLGDGAAVLGELDPEGGDVDLFDWDDFDDADLTDLDEELRERFRARAIPTPRGVATGRQRLSDPRRYEVPVTIVSCEFPAAQLRELGRDGHPYVAELTKIRSVDYIDLPTGHWPQFTRPDELADALAGAVSARQ
ncbi:alpha/beta fold hydrolase [Leifsonia poae]|uniref:alpha/beta fold hydrolase n=1 Tax=Leifsonia poae TaxID=110933 RepID=UPI001CBE1E26|nr:alpha/beta hydrolase [Leifsonia poae]